MKIEMEVIDISKKEEGIVVCCLLLKPERRYIPFDVEGERYDTFVEEYMRAATKLHLGLSLLEQ